MTIARPEGALTKLDETVHPGWRGNRSAATLRASCLAPVAIGLVLRLFWLRLASFPDTDGTIYGALARDVAAGHLGAATFLAAAPPVLGERPPLYVLLMGLLARMGVEPLVAGVLVSALAGVAAIPLMAALGQRIGGERAGRATAWIAALHPALVWAGGQVLREALAVALFAASAAALSSGTRRGAWLGGALLGLAAANRIDTFLFGLPVLALAVWLESANPAGPRLGRLAAGAALALALYGTALLLATGSPLPRSDVAAIQADLERLPAGLSWAGALLHSLSEWMLALLAHLRAATFWLLPPALLALVVAGILGAAPARSLLPAGFYVLLAASHTSAVEARYLLPTLVFLLPVAGAGVAGLAEHHRRHPGRAEVMILLLLALSFTPSLSIPLRLPLEPENVPLGEVEAGRALAGMEPVGGPIMSRHPLVAYVARRRWVLLPRASPGLALEAARRSNVSFIVLDRPSLGRDRPELASLLDREDAAWRWRAGSAYEVAAFALPLRSTVAPP